MVKKTKLLEINLSKEWKQNVVKSLVLNIKNKKNNKELNDIINSNNLKKRMGFKTFKTIDSKINFFLESLLKSE